MSFQSEYKKCHDTKQKKVDDAAYICSKYPGMQNWCKKLKFLKLQSEHINCLRKCSKKCDTERCRDHMFELIKGAIELLFEKQKEIHSYANEGNTMKTFSFYQLVEEQEKLEEQISTHAGSMGNNVPAEDEDVEEQFGYATGVGTSTNVPAEDEENEENVEEMAPPGWEGSVKAMKKHKGITNPWALSWYLKHQGAHPHYTKSGKKK